MSTTINTTENLKEKAKLIRNFLKEKYNVEVSVGHSLELISQVSGHKDWNTASALSKSKVNKNNLPVLVKTVGGMKRALAQFDDSMKIEGDGTCGVGAILQSQDHFNYNENSVLYNKYSFIVEKGGDDLVSLVLKLEDQTLGDLSGIPESPISLDEIDFFEI